jgi:hypothetical protein
MAAIAELLKGQNPALSFSKKLNAWKALGTNARTGLECVSAKGLIGAVSGIANFWGTSF